MKAKLGIWGVHVLVFMGFVLLAGASIICFLARPLCPYEAIGGILEASSNRSSASFFTMDYYEGVIARARLAGIYFAVSALGLAIGWKWIARQGRGWSGRHPGLGAIASVWRRGWRLLISDRTVLVMLVVAVVLRLLYLFQPASADEVRGYYAWTARPFLLAISDYRAPQHLLYTILDYPVVRMFGNGEGAIRLPALAAGILLPALVFLVGRKWFGRNAGLLAAGLFVANPIFVHFSVNGRAYTLHACLVLLLWLSATMSAGPSRGRWYALLVCSGVAGLMALPTMIYPLAGTYVWMLASQGLERGRDGGSRRKTIAQLFFCGLATLWLGCLAYLPAFVASDKWYSVDADDVSIALPWPALPGRLGSFIIGAYRTWNADIPGPAAALLLVVFAIGAFVWWRKKALHLLAFNGLGILGVSLVLRIVPYPRTALYFGAAYFLIAGAGLASVLTFFADRQGKGRSARAANVATGLVVLFMAINLLSHNRHGFTAQGELAPGIRDAMAALKDQAAIHDHIVCVRPSSGPVYYYHLRNRMDCRLWFIPDEFPPVEILSGTQAVYFVVNTYGGQSLDGVLKSCSWPEEMLAGQRISFVYSNRYAAIYRR